MLPRQISNISLQVSDVPALDVPSLDPVDFTAMQDDDWGALWTFALTFDGYRYFGGDEGAGDRLGDFANSIRHAYERDSALPEIDLAQLRACLFFEQRRWCKHSMERTCPADAAIYLGALVDAIRRAIT